MLEDPLQLKTIVKFIDVSNQMLCLLLLDTPTFDSMPLIGIHVACLVVAISGQADQLSILIPIRERWKEGILGNILK